jgi:hypothetical protein
MDMGWLHRHGIYILVTWRYQRNPSCCLLSIQCLSLVDPIWSIHDARRTHRKHKAAQFSIAHSKEANQERRRMASSGKSNRYLNFKGLGDWFLRFPVKSVSATHQRTTPPLQPLNLSSYPNLSFRHLPLCCRFYDVPSNAFQIRNADRF